MGDLALGTPFHESAVKHGRKTLESRLEHWSSSLRLHGGRSFSLVGGELESASASETGIRGRESGLSGSSETTIKQESNQLITRAKENGFFLIADEIAALRLLDRTIAGGTEHDAYRVAQGDKAIVIRNTVEGSYGFINGASPVQYFRRLDRNNKVFPQTPIHLIGVSQNQDGMAVIWTAQPFVKGEVYSNERKLIAAMVEHGWNSYNRPNSYIHAESGIVIRDASNANVLHVGDDLFPVDVIVSILPALACGAPHDV